jgi:hypothetical protein
MRPPVVALVLLAACAPPPTARAAGLEFHQRFSSSQPGTATGVRIHLVYPDYNGKPKSPARLVLSLPPGTRFDEAVVPACQAANGDFFVQGLAACPADTRVGGGTATAVTGFGPPIDPVSADAHQFHAPGAIINAFTAPGTDRVLVVSRVHIAGATLTDVVADDTPASSPGGPPDGRTQAKQVDLAIPARGAFVTTPPVCPDEGSWNSRAVVTYEDGTTDAGTSTTPCERPAASAPPKKRHRRKRHRRRRHHRSHRAASRAK